MVAVLTRLFGVHNLALAEDVVQDAFLRALTVWQFRGLPDNPAAWLMAAARNRALDMLRRERTARTSRSPSSWRGTPPSAGSSASASARGREASAPASRPTRGNQLTHLARRQPAR